MFKDEKAAKYGYLEQNEWTKSLFQLDLDDIGNRLAYSNYHTKLGNQFRVFDFPEIPFGWTRDMVSPVKSLKSVPTSTTSTSERDPKITKIKLAPPKQKKPDDIKEWLDDLIG
jgi:hypothetical protein